MAKHSEPIVLELAPLPRDQIGPFLLLGVAKDATKEEVEAQWAERVKWARRQLVKTPLEDVNWAKEMLLDREKRVRADVASLNADTVDRALQQIARRYGAAGPRPTPGWLPLDSEKPLADYTPEVERIDVESVRSALEVPAVPEETPSALLLLRRFVEPRLDPWNIDCVSLSGEPKATA